MARFCRVCSYTLALSHSHTPTLSHSHTLTLSHSHTLTLSHSHTLTLSHTHTLSHTQGEGLAHDEIGLDIIAEAIFDPAKVLERYFFIDNLLVRIHLIVEMILVDRLCAMGA